MWESAERVYKSGLVYRKAGTSSLIPWPTLTGGKACSGLITGGVCNLWRRLPESIAYMDVIPHDGNK